MLEFERKSADPQPWAPGGGDAEPGGVGGAIKGGGARPYVWAQAGAAVQSEYATIKPRLSRGSRQT